MRISLNLFELNFFSFYRLHALTHSDPLCLCLSKGSNAKNQTARLLPSYDANDLLYTTHLKKKCVKALDIIVTCKRQRGRRSQLAWSGTVLVIQTVIKQTNQTGFFQEGTDSCISHGLLLQEFVQCCLKHRLVASSLSSVSDVPVEINNLSNCQWK